MSKSPAQELAERILSLSCPEWKSHQSAGKDWDGDCMVCKAVGMTTRMVQVSFNKQRELYVKIVQEAPSTAVAAETILRSRWY